MDSPIWELRQRSLFAGEQIAILRMQRIRDTFDGMLMTRTQKPDEYFNRLKQQLLDDVAVERDLSTEEREQKMREHNLNVFKTLGHG